MLMHRSIGLVPDLRSMDPSLMATRCRLVADSFDDKRYQAAFKMSPIMFTSRVLCSTLLHYYLTDAPSRTFRSESTPEGIQTFHHPQRSEKVPQPQACLGHRFFHMRNPSRESLHLFVGLLSRSFRSAHDIQCQTRRHFRSVYLHRSPLKD